MTTGKRKSTRWRHIDEYGQTEATGDDVTRELILGRTIEDGGRMSIPAPSKTKATLPLKDKNALNVTFDWLKVWVFGNNPDGLRQCGELARLQEIAKSDDPLGSTFTVGDNIGAVQPTGMGQNGYPMPFRVRIAGCSLGFADLRKEWNGKGKRAVMVVEFPGQYCYGRDPFELAEEVFQWAKVFGFEKIETQVSRVDIALDRYDYEVKEAEIRRILGQVVTRAADDSTFRSRRKTTGIRYGGQNSPCKLTIYDKRLELTKDADKAANFYAAYPDAKGRQITRYEWSLKREALMNRHGVDNLPDLLSVLPDLFRYLSHDWYREIDETTDKRPTRCEVLKDWSLLQRRAAKLLNPQGGETVKRKAVAKPAPDGQALLDQAVGCLLSRCATMGLEIKGVRELFASASTAIFGSPQRDLEVVERLKERFKELQVRSRHYREELQQITDESIRMQEFNIAAREVYERWLVQNVAPF